jgi:glycosyltransferase involved in cell wall biosynthesis
MTKRVAFVVGTVSGGTGTHVRMLAAGLASRGIAVTVASPSIVGDRFGFPALPGTAFAPVEIGARPSPADLAAVLRLRAMLRRPGPDGDDRPDAVHAHGLRAGAFTVLALAGMPGEGRPGLVVTVHNAPPARGGAAALVYRVLERIVARGADLVLCVSPDLEQRMRAAGARRVGRAVVPAADRGTGHGEKVRFASGDAKEQSAVGAAGPEAVGPGAAGPGETAGPGAADVAAGAADVAGRAVSGRPVVLAVGRLVAQKGFGTLLKAAAGWRDLEPPPLVVIAGDGPMAGELRARAAALGVEVTFAGQRDDVPALLRSATVFVLPSRWEGQPLVLQEALRAGAAIVATRAGGIPALTGEDAALLVPPDDPARLAAAVTSVLTDRQLAATLRAAASARAAKLPSEADAVTAVLAAYAASGTGRHT